MIFNFAQQNSILKKYHSLKVNQKDKDDDIYTYSIIKEKHNIEELLKENNNGITENEEDSKSNDFNKTDKSKDDFLSQAPLKNILSTIINNIDEEKLDINSDVVGDIKKKLHKVETNTTKLIEKKENFLSLYNQSEMLKKKITSNKSNLLKFNTLQTDSSKELKPSKSFKVQFKLNNNYETSKKFKDFSKISSPNLESFNKSLKKLSSIKHSNLIERSKSTERNKQKLKINLDNDEKKLKKNLTEININKNKLILHFFKDHPNLFKLSIKDNKNYNKTQILKKKKKKNDTNTLILPKSLFYNFPKSKISIESLIEQTQNDLSYLKKYIKSTLFNSNNNLNNNLNKNINNNINNINNNINNNNKNTNDITNINNNNINNTELLNNSEKNSFDNKSDTESVRLIKRITKYGLVGIIKNKEKFRILLRKKLVYDSVLSDSEEEYNEVHEKGKFFIMSDGLFKIILDIILILFVLYDLIVDTLYIGLYNKNLNEKLFILHIFDFIKEFFYILDFFLGFFMTYYSKEELLVSKLDFLIYNYLSTWFLSDLLQAIPFHLILYYKLPKSINYSQSYNNPYALYYLFTLIQKMKVFKILSENNNIIAYLNNFEHFTFYGSVYISLIGFFLILHNISCIYIFLGKFTYPNWIVHLGIEQDNFFEIYIYALYYIISTVTTVGYGDVSTYTCLERFFGIIILIVGIMGYSVALTSVSGYIHKMNSKAESYQDNIKFLKNLKENNIYFSQDLYDKIIRYLRYSHDKYDDTNLIVENLPFSLRNTLLLEMYNPMIKNFTFFKKISNTDFIIQILLKFKPILSMKNDILLKDGEFQEEVIFIKNGRISLVVPVNLYENYDFSLHKMKKNEEFKRNTTLIYDHLTNIKDKKSKEEEEEEIEKNKKYIQILVLRENEHYGIINIFLNKRSTLCAKVKSKKAELLLLNKNDVVEISNCYSQIWKRINKKSVTNYLQIDLLIQKTLQMYYLSQGIKNNLFTGFVSENEEDKNFNTMNLTEHNLASITEDSEENVNNTQINNNNINSINNNNNNNNSINNNNNNNLLFVNNNNITLKRSEESAKKQSNTPLKISVKPNSSNASNFDETYDNNNSENMITSNEKSEESDSQVKDSESSGMTDFIKNNKNTTFISSNNINQLFKSATLQRIGTLSNSNIGSFKFKNNSIQKEIIFKENKTPFKPSDINKEIYPNEEFIFRNNKNNSKKSAIQTIISSKLYQEILKDSPNDFRTNNQQKNKIIYNESFIINASYKNLNSMAGFKYIKNKKLQEKIEITIFENTKKIKKTNRPTFNTSNLVKFHSKKSQFSHISENTNSLIKNHYFDRKISSIINNSHNNNNFNSNSNININNINNISNNNIIMLRRNTTNGFDINKFHRKKSFSYETIPDNMNNQMNLNNISNVNSLRTYNQNNITTNTQNEKVLSRKMSFQSNKLIKFYNDKKDLLNIVNNNMKQNMNINNMNTNDNFCSEFLLNEIRRNETQKIKKKFDN